MKLFTWFKGIFVKEKVNDQPVVPEKVIPIVEEKISEPVLLPLPEPVKQPEAIVIPVAPEPIIIIPTPAAPEPVAAPVVLVPTVSEPAPVVEQVWPFVAAVPEAVKEQPAVKKQRKPRKSKK